MTSSLDLPRPALHGAVTIGNYDGVHRGHQAILARLRSLAQQIQGPAVVFTFRPPPAALLRPGDAPWPLTTYPQREQLLRSYGVDEIICYPTTLELLEWTDHEFFQRMVRDQLQAGAMVEGSNFRFGRNRQGDVNVLRRLCQQAGMLFEAIPPLEIPIHACVASSGGEETMGSESMVVSSSRIRELLTQGHVEQAAELLGRPHSLAGRVVPGEQRGATLGFPTANLQDWEVLAPAHGVYAGTAIHQQRTYRAAIHFGPNPTFDQSAGKLEVHLLDFQGQLYQQPLEIHFHYRLRPVRRFPSIESLVQQLHADVASVRGLIPLPVTSHRVADVRSGVAPR